MRSPPSGTATGTTAKAAGTAAPGGQALDQPGQQRQPLGVPTAGPVGPVAPRSQADAPSARPARSAPPAGCWRWAPARPAAPAPRREEHHAKPFRVLSQREQRERGNRGPKIVRMGPHAFTTIGNSHGNNRQGSGNSSTRRPALDPLGTCPASNGSTSGRARWRSAARLTGSAAAPATSSPAGTPSTGSAPVRQQRQRLDVPTVGPAGPVVRPQLG